MLLVFFFIIIFLEAWVKQTLEYLKKWELHFRVLVTHSGYGDSTRL